ncbi:hypothetical protein Pmani_016238 [Petrolisthes manimaculis]|uniref:Grh/CP2 DB domain-containing protein n=1 Tax=Petrolisthes manimaculis TaxID=1843537 RepID=A0AAE1PQ32_9EUCA|nr:hypothetical protein Pmani_016238 [Petrolisthes manimaculis]
MLHSSRTPLTTSGNNNLTGHPFTSNRLGMGEPGVEARGGTGEGGGGRTRKRILDPLEAHNDDMDNPRRPAGVFADWQDAIKTIGVPNKKGFMTVVPVESLVGGQRVSWENEDIDQGLAADLDDSLSGLGVDISTATYNMSEALLALPAVSLFKDEASNTPNSGAPMDHTSVASTSSGASPATFDETSQTNTTDKLFKLLTGDSVQDGPSPTIHQLLQQHIPPITSSSSSHHLHLHSPDHEHDPLSLGWVTVPYEDNRFQYILGAATSVATKVSEESLSYLNQGQSYEIKVKKLGDLTSCRGKRYHSVIRVCFHERRLQYMERQQLESWRQMRPGERILEVDIPLSYGIFDVQQEPRSLNTCEFDWDPTKEVGVYIKVNCISTEFTPKKHGGEKGVPFRIQVETYAQTSSGLERLYVCACQIKVFKLKGADRKHKQDREKIMKRSLSEQEKYQPSCECTILSELCPEAVYIPVPESSSPPIPPVSAVKSLTIRGPSPPDELGQMEAPPIDTKPLQPPSSTQSQQQQTPQQQSQQQQSQQQQSQQQKSQQPKQTGVENGIDNEEEQDNRVCGMPLGSDSTPDQTAAWLVGNRFSRYLSTLAQFSGTDLLRLSRSDLTDICGIADGPRLYYALHAKSVAPLLRVYVCLEHEHFYHALYLDTLTTTALTRRLAALLRVPASTIQDLFLQGPSGIHILVTDEVVQNMADESMLSIEVLQDSTGQRYRLLMRLS